MSVIVRVSGTKREANKEAIFVFLKAIQNKIRQDQDRNDRNASGKFERSLTIREVSNGGQLEGEGYVQQLVAGRRPGKFPPLKPILEWIDDKGISPKGISKQSLAYLIGRKMAKQGSDIFLRKRPALDVKGIVKSEEPSLKQALIKAGRIEINTAIYKALGKEPKKIR